MVRIVTGWPPLFQDMVQNVTESGLRLLTSEEESAMECRLRIHFIPVTFCILHFSCRNYSLQLKYFNLKNIYQRKVCLKLCTVHCLGKTLQTTKQYFNSFKI